LLGDRKKGSRLARDREHLIAFWRRLQKAAFELTSRNVAITLRDAAWLYAKGYDIDAPVETMVNFIVYVDRLELGGGDLCERPLDKRQEESDPPSLIFKAFSVSRGGITAASPSKRRKSSAASEPCFPRLVISAPD
jgi:hypothetical protein